VKNVCNIVSAFSAKRAREKAIEEILERIPFEFGDGKAGYSDGHAKAIQDLRSILYLMKHI